MIFFHEFLKFVRLICKCFFTIELQIQIQEISGITTEVLRQYISFNYDAFLFILRSLYLKFKNIFKIIFFY